MSGSENCLQSAHLGLGVMAVPFRAQPILRILGSRKDHNPFYLDYTMYPCYLDPRFFDFVGTRVVKVSGYGF